MRVVMMSFEGAPNNKCCDEDDDDLRSDQWVWNAVMNPKS